MAGVEVEVGGVASVRVLEGEAQRIAELRDGDQVAMVGHKAVAQQRETLGS